MKQYCLILENAFNWVDIFVFSFNEKPAFVRTPATYPNSIAIKDSPLCWDKNKQSQFRYFSINTSTRSAYPISGSIIADQHNINLYLQWLTEVCSYVPLNWVIIG